jgi:hypothetical protein
MLSGNVLNDFIVLEVNVYPKFGPNSNGKFTLDLS